MNRAIIAGVVIVVGLAVILGGIFVIPRDVRYDPQPGLRAQILIDLDPRSNEPTPFAEGITADSQGMLFVGDNQGRVLRIDPNNPRLEVVGKVPAAGGTTPTLLGLAFDRRGDLFIATGAGGQVWKLERSKISGTNPGEATLYASGLGFANGLAFDAWGRLLVTDSSGGQVWNIDTQTREKRIFATGIVSNDRSVPFGANGIAIGPRGDIFVVNTGSGIIHQIETAKEDGRLLSVLIWRNHPSLKGADGIAFDAAGNLWVAVNARNAVLAITPDKKIVEVSINGNTGPLEAPASLAFSGDTLYVTNADFAVGENQQRGPGVGPSIAKLEVSVSGLRIPR